MSAGVLHAQGLTLALGGQRLLRGVDLRVQAGQTLALVGESGSGKTLTALSCIRLEPAGAQLAGHLSWNGQSLLGRTEAELSRIRGRGIGLLFQDAAGSLHPARTVGRQLIRLLRWHGQSSRARAKRDAWALLERMGLGREVAQAFAHELSGGQAQRAALALTLACGPQLLICDEPTSALDVTRQRQVMELLSAVQRERGLGLLLITHDLALAAEWSDEIAVMRHGQVQECQPARQLWTTPRSAYGQALLACRPTLAQRWARLPMLDADGELLAGVALGPAAVQPPACAEASPLLLQVQQLGYAYPARGLARWLGRRERVLHPLSFALRQGRTLGIVGESGSGKSTLAQCLVRLLEPEGAIRFAGIDVLGLRGAALRQWRRRVQMVFQNPYTALNPALRIGEQLAEPLQIHGLGTRDEWPDRVRALLAEVGLPADAALRLPHQFSGGQRQRIAIARALACAPQLLICDESVSALDVSVQAQVLNLLAELKARRGLSLIFISHDLAVIRFLADEVLVLERGHAVEYGEAAQVYAQPAHACTRALLAAVPRGPR